MATQSGLSERVTLKTDLAKLFASAPKGGELQIAQSAAMQLQKQARAIKAEKVVTLGNGEAFVRRGATGEIRAAKQVIPLSDRDGHLYCIPGYTKRNGDVVPDKWKVSAEGYTWINKFAGVSTLTPPTQVVDGRVVENPYIATDPKHPSIMTMVHVRVVALGRTAVGNLVAVDYHLRWDPAQYLVEALKKKQSYIPDALYDMKGSIFERKQADGEANTLIFLPFAMAGFGDVLGLVADVTNKEVQGALKDYQQLVKFGERRARTICVRNALRHHPAIAVSTVNPKDVYGPPDESGNVYLIDRQVMVPIWSWIEGPSMLDETNTAARALMQGAPLPENITVSTLHADNALDDDEDGTDPIPGSVDDAEIVRDGGELPPEPAGFTPSEEEQAEILQKEREQAAREAGQS